MKKLLALLACLMFSSTAFAGGVFIPKPLATLDVYAVSNLKGNIMAEAGHPGALKLVGCKEKLLQENPYGTAFLSAGGNFNMESELQKGNLSTLFVLNNMGITATVPTAEDFKDEIQMKNYASGSTFAWLAANITTEDGKIPAPFKPYVLFNREGVNIGVIGLLGEKTAAAAKNQGYQVADSVKAASRSIKELKSNGADIIIIISDMTASLAAKDKIQGEVANVLQHLDGVDGVLLTGSGENAAPTGNGENAAIAGMYEKVPVVAGGQSGNVLAQLHFLYNRIEKEMLVGVPKLVEVAEYPECSDKKLRKRLEQVMAIGSGIRNYQNPAPAVKISQKKKDRNSIYRNINPVKTESKVKKGAYLAKNLRQLSNYPNGRSTLAQFYTDNLQYAAKADVVLIPGNTFKYPLDPGAIYEGAVDMSMPEDANIITGEMSGRDILDVLEKGMEPGNIMRFAGLQVEADLSKAFGARIRKIRMADGTAFDPNRIYKVAVSSAMLKDGSIKSASLANQMDKKSQKLFLKFILRSSKTVDFVGDDRLILK